MRKRVPRLASRVVAVVLLVALASACAATTRERPDRAASPDSSTEQPWDRLVAVDVYGLGGERATGLLRDHKDTLRSLGEAMLGRETTRSRAELLEQVCPTGLYAYCKPSLVTYFEDDGERHYLTLDIVEERDGKSRMPFSEPPEGVHPDPAGLIATWTEYEDTVWRLIEAKTMTAERTDCPALHCFGDHTHPEVRALTRKIADLVPAHTDELLQIVAGDRRASRRADAAFLLAYSPETDRVVPALLAAFRDPSSLVRNNAMRVVAEIAAEHPDIEIPLEPVLDALAYPATTDRNKAAAILAAILEHPTPSSTRRRIAKQAGATLIAMLRLRQPNNHDFAYRILRQISGESFPARDYAAWERWLSRYSSNS